MKKFLLALILCTIGFSAHATTGNIICSVNNKTVVYENVDVYFHDSGLTRIMYKKNDIRIQGLYTCIFVKRGREGWEAEWKKAKKIMERSVE